MTQVLESLPIGESTAAVFVYLGVNDAQPLWLYPDERDAYGVTLLPFGSPAWESVYARRTRDFYERICQRGAQRAVVLLPVDVNRGELHRRLERIRNLQTQAAARSSCAVALTTSGDLGNFEVDGAARRMPDGFHMSSLGARIVWERVRAQVVQLLSEPRQDG
jgi:lysophospholipase L1-like esterase